MTNPQPHPLLPLFEESTKNQKNPRKKIKNPRIKKKPVARNHSEFLLGCDSTVRLLDLRRKKVSTLLRRGGSQISVHPTDPNLISVGVRIYDLRQPKKALLKLWSGLDSLQWSPTSGEQLLAVQDAGRVARVFSTEQLLRGEEGLLLSKKFAEPLAAQWNPWCKDSLFLSDPTKTTGKLR